MLNKETFTEEIIQVLTCLDMYCEDAVYLLLGTCAVESAFGKYTVQLGGGPARGVFQMEPNTEKDIWNNYLIYHPEIIDDIKKCTGVSGPSPKQLEINLRYSIAMCRIHYRRVKAPLPNHNNIEELGEYWKRHYNTPLGKGTVQKFVDAYHMYIG